MWGQGVNGITIVFQGHTSICLLFFGFFLLVGYLSIDKYLSLVGNGWWRQRVGGRQGLVAAKGWWRARVGGEEGLERGRVGGGRGLEKGKSWRRGRAGEGLKAFLVLIDKVKVSLVLLATLSVLLTTKKTCYRMRSRPRLLPENHR